MKLTNTDNIPRANFIHYNRGFTAVKRHLPMILKPFIFSLIMVLIWKVLRDYGIHLNKESEVSITAAVIPVIGIIYGVKAGLVLNNVWEEYKKMSTAVIKKDIDTFLLYRDEQIPIVIHLLLGVLAFFILVLIMLLNYDDIWTGIVSVFSASFVLFIMSVVAIELDHPTRSIWFKERIPEEWLEIDIVEYNKKKNN